MVGMEKFACACEMFSWPFSPTMSLFETDEGMLDIISV